MDITLGRYVYHDVTPQFLYYADGTRAIRLFSIEEDYPEPMLTLTVNLTEYGHLPSELGSFFVKDYSENAGIADALVSAGVIRRLEDGATCILPHGGAVHEFVLDGNWAELFQSMGR